AAAARLLLPHGLSAHGLLLRLGTLGSEHALLRPARTAALLAPDALDLLLARTRRAPDARLDHLGKPAAGEEAIHRLRARLLALDRDARRQVPQHHAGGDLVDVLAAPSARADEALDQVVLADAEGREARRQRGLLLRTHGKHRSHARRYTSVTSHAARAMKKGLAKRCRRGELRLPMPARAAAAALILVTLARAGPAGAGNPISGFQETVFQGGLSSPTAIAFLPAPDGRMLITEQGGALKLSDGSSVKTLATIPVCSQVEMGLLGVAVDPSFNSNGFIYLYRTDNSNGCSPTVPINQVVRVKMVSDTVNLTSLTILI